MKRGLFILEGCMLLKKEEVKVRDKNRTMLFFRIRFLQTMFCFF